MSGLLKILQTIAGPGSGRVIDDLHQAFAGTNVLVESITEIYAVLPCREDVKGFHSSIKEINPSRLGVLEQRPENATHYLVHLNDKQYLVPLPTQLSSDLTI